MRTKRRQSAQDGIMKGSIRISGLTKDLSEERRFRLFLLANVLIGFGACVDSSAFNNYLREIYHLDVTRRTILEFPREIPGFLVFIFIGMLSGLGDVRIAAVAQIITAVGMFSLGVIPRSTR
jgi:hypothetical protein